jgi:hypothetical protein
MGSLAYDTTLEAELGGLLAATGLAWRQRRAITRRLGWDGERPGTLAEAARLTGYTRERVRQLQAVFGERAARLRPALPVTRAALELVGSAAPASRGEVATLLAAEGLSERPFDVGGVLNAAAVAGLAVDVVVAPEAVLGREDTVLAPVVGRVARRLLERSGATTAAAVAELTGLSRPRVVGLLELDADVRWLETDGHWLTAEPLGGPVGSALRKLVSVSRDASSYNVQRALASLRPAVELPLPVVAELFALVAAEGVEDELSTTERLLVDATRAEGGVFRVAEAAPRLEAHGVARTTASVTLSRSPVFLRRARGRWTLAV